MSSIVWRATGENAQRVIMAGMSGSGKTTLAVPMIKMASRAVYFDVKGFNDPGFPIHQASEFFDLVTVQVPTPTGVKPRLVAQGNAAKLAAVLARETHITVQVRRDRQSIPAVDQLDAVAEAAYYVGNLLFVVDDALGVVTSQPTTFVLRCFTEGRARGVGFLSMVQRVHGMPLVFLSEAFHAVFFVMTDERDRARISETRGAAVGNVVRELEPCPACAEGPGTTLPHRHDFAWHVLGQTPRAMVRGGADN